MGAAAQLHRDARHIHHPHHVAVSLAEHRHGAGGAGLLDRHLLNLQGVGIGNPAVDQGLDPLQFGRRHGTGAVEVEAEPLEIDQRTGLADRGIHHLLEGGLQQVGGAVVGLHAAAAGPVHPGHHQITHRQAAALHPAAVHKHAAVAAHALDRHDHPFATASLPRQHATVAHLAAALAIEGGGIEHQLHGITGAGALGGLAIHHQGQHAAGVLQGLITHKGGGLQLSSHLLNRPQQGEVEAHRRRLGPLALGLHRRLEARQIHREAMLLGDLLGELQREAIGVVELEGLLTGDPLRAGRQHLRQQLLAALQGFEEAGLLAFQFRENHAAALQQLGISRRHQGDRRLPPRRQEGLVDAQQPPVAHHPPQQATQDVATAQVAGGHAIADQLGDGAAVVADHLQARLALAIEGAVINARQARRRFDQRIDQIGFVVVGHRLQDLGHALQAHAGVDVAVGQRREHTLRIAVVLHEHKVVELDEARVVLEIDAIVAAFGLEVVVDLRAGAAGAGRARGPEVVGLIHADDALGVHPHRVAPDRLGFVVFTKDAHDQIAGIEAKDAGAQLPGPGNRLRLEVITEREVAQHLEIGVVPCRAAHVLDVVGADALLGAGRPRCRPLLLAQEHRLEGQHAGDREQHGGVLRHQRGTGDGLVAPLLVEAQEGRPDLGAAAGNAPPGGGRGRGSGHGGGGTSDRKEWQAAQKPPELAGD